MSTKPSKLLYKALLTMYRLRLVRRHDRRQRSSLRPPETRPQATVDNRKALSRHQPGGGQYGSDTCRQGFVWREAQPGDNICVTPATRSQARQENRTWWSHIDPTFPRLHLFRSLISFPQRDLSICPMQALSHQKTK